VRKKILVTGGAGYIGSVIVERLIDHGYRVVILDNLSTGNRRALHPQADFVQGDIRDITCLVSILQRARLDAVIHMAAKALVPESITDPVPFYSSNLVGGIQLVDAMVRHGVKKIIFSSTAAVYGEPMRVPLEEDHPASPLNSYGETKLSFERLLLWCAKANKLDATIFRYFNAAGASKTYGEAHVPETHLIPSLLNAAQTNRVSEIFGTDYDTPDGTCIRDFIHVTDLADAHMRALELPSREGFRIFNLGSETGYSVLQVIESVERVTGQKLEKRILARRLGDPARLVASSRKARVELNWVPRFQCLESIVESAWLWRKAHPKGYAE